MEHRVGRAAVAVLASAAVVLSCVALGAGPASARDNESTIVTKATVKNAWVAAYLGGGYEVDRTEDYTASLQGRYRYGFFVSNLEDDERACTLRRYGVVISAAPCWDSMSGGGLDLQRSGKYELTVGRKLAARWTFTRPKAVPPILAAATCEITSLRPGRVTDRGPIFVLTTNDQCTDGDWYYDTFEGEGFGTFARFEMPANGRVLAMGLNGNTTPLTVNFVFEPNGYVQLTASALATNGATPPTWTPVPHTEGY